MKKIFFAAFLFTSLLSSQSFAARVECSTLRPVNNINYDFFIERGFGSYWQDAVLIAIEPNVWTRYIVSRNPMIGFNQVDYWGSGVSLSVDLAFDRYPRPFLRYDARLRVDTVNRGMPFDLLCEFLPF